MSWNPVQEPRCQTAGCPQNIDMIVIPRIGDIGNFEIRRALPSVDRQMVGPFIFFDQMGPGTFIAGQGVDVRPHPHIGLATITYLFNGSLDHRDSLGFHERIFPGDINLMKAGSGIVHSERTGQDIRESSSQLFGIQSWIALPKDNEEDECVFKQYQQQELPVVQDDGVNIRVIAGSYEGVVSPVEVISPTLYIDIAMKAGKTVAVPADYQERALYAVEGDLAIGGVDYPAMQLLVLKPNQRMDVTAKTDARCVVVGGEPLEGPRYIWWNFVSSSEDRIEQAKSDWKNKNFPVIDGDPEFIPLPD